MLIAKCLFLLIERALSQTEKSSPNSHHVEGRRGKVDGRLSAVPLKSECAGSEGERKLLFLGCFSFLLQAFMRTFSKALLSVAGELPGPHPALGLPPKAKEISEKQNCKTL